MSTAFVLSGGANLGALQVGMLRALAERGIRPDALVATSAGALNAAYIADRGLTSEVVESLGEVWRSLSAWQLFRPGARQLLGAFTGRQSALFSSRGLRSLIETHLDFDRIEEAATPLTVVATDLLTGDQVDIDHGPAAEAVLASSAISGIFPAVAFNGRILVDGGVADNTPVSHAVESGSDIVYVLPCGYPCALVEPPTTVAGTILHTMSLLIQQRLVRDIREYTSSVDLRVVPPPCPLDVGPLDFSNADELIARGYDSACHFLDVDEGRRAAPADHIDFHVHATPGLRR
ncbi:MAG TPA: patatin-like phospholipase family protein [Gordonia sp. (in: high G+C Gram-positive bacteria)]|uniref:patatin-like phospholipase family protein n=1 Tax=unclassified Gordonia (in: high G+C Gram-positive bacteria) TaxID=2657482 RepID=UPI000FA7CC66|nr:MULTISPECIES: patatin-like phospholipase family protein [unclassified Gordonia (in: high G+C Gram-positive bacteria)]RUP40958.1 MAG: patatin-like phospholipase family protein [Gordonia sp. (in: high G+C Gram-positive bacteria)]HNP55778.1 patatin-like phospholipase family protein [Gordonia sp. (in: high G+C Gram-positive bacteria)]HRC49514.1 patatin-like phospholipase family protein [Gordonia sp. (in: high G+C Gram-positive bacteria)]